MHHWPTRIASYIRYNRWMQTFEKSRLTLRWKLGSCLAVCRPSFGFEIYLTEHSHCAGDWMLVLIKISQWVSVCVCVALCWDWPENRSHWEQGKRVWILWGREEGVSLTGWLSPLQSLNIYMTCWQWVQRASLCVGVFVSIGRGVDVNFAPSSLADWNTELYSCTYLARDQDPAVSAICSRRHPEASISVQRHQQATSCLGNDTDKRCWNKGVKDVVYNSILVSTPRNAV